MRHRVCDDRVPPGVPPPEGGVASRGLAVPRRSPVAVHTAACAHRHAIGSLCERYAQPAVKRLAGPAIAIRHTEPEGRSATA